MLLTRCDQAEPAALARIRGEIKRWAPLAMVLETSHQPTEWINAQIAKVRAHCFLSNFVCLFSSCAKESHISLQVAAVGIQCVEGKTSARLEAKPGASISLARDKWHSIPSDLTDKLARLHPLLHGAEMCGWCEPAELGANRHLILASAPADTRHRRVVAAQNALEKRSPIPHNCQVHDFVSVLLNSRVLLGSHLAKPARGPAPKAEALHLRRLRRNLSLNFANRFRAETVTLRAMESKQKSKPPPGAG